MSPTVFVLTPRAEVRSAIDRILSARGYRIEMVDNAAGSVARIGKRTPAYAILDISARSDALKLLRALARQGLPIAVIVVADPSQPAANTEALRLGAIDLVTPPIHEYDLLAALSNAREFAHLASGPERPLPDPPSDGVFGASPRMREVLEIVRRAAASRCPLLLVGERGTGRELMARTVHAESPACREPFVKIACGDDTDDLESAIRRAGAGVVYLEELTEMSAERQGQFDRWLASRARSADIRLKKVAVGPRLIAGVSPDVDDAVRRRVVRRSLVDALSIVRVELPPLRQRPQDIPLLAVHLLKQACRDHDVPVKTFSRSALTLLSALPWYGNAAELRALAERLAVLVPRGIVLQEDVLQHVRFDGAQSRGSGQGPLRAARDRFEREFIAGVLQRHGGRMGAAAKELGIERTNLYRKMKHLRVRRGAIET
jgi:DNA-binding NtrC family response regulator